MSTAAGLIVAHSLTEATVDDATVGIDLIAAAAGDVASVTADAAYDTVAFTPCFAAPHSPSPTTDSPVLSTIRCSGLWAGVQHRRTARPSATSISVVKCAASQACGQGPTAPSGSVPLFAPWTDRGAAVTPVASVVAGRYAARSASGRFRVRGKDCVRLKERHDTSPR